MDALQVVVFDVSVLGESGHEYVGTVQAQTPEDALKGLQNRRGHRPGIYSVWDPDDPHGMPLLEETL